MILLVVWNCCSVMSTKSFLQTSMSKFIYIIFRKSLAGGLKHFLFSSLFLEMIQFDEHIFQMDGSITN